VTAYAVGWSDRALIETLVECSDFAESVDSLVDELVVIRQRFCGGQMLVLLRVATRSSTGELIEPFANSGADDNVGVTVGSFETGGKVRS
jgi:hypothetical protein